MGLDELMKKAVDQPDHADLIHRPVLNGHYELTGVNFKYGEDDPKPSLMIAKLEIKVGEKIAILGRNGQVNRPYCNCCLGCKHSYKAKLNYS